jgi:hypothetical protein
MNILLIDNTSYDLNTLPEEVDDTMRFAVLDNGNPADPDFFFVPLIFLESFNSPAIVLSINGKEVTMPLDWCLAVGCSEAGSDLEVLPLTSLNERGFEAFLFNPLTSYQTAFGKIEVVNFYNDVKWFFPKMKNGQLLAVPIDDTDNSLCAFFVKDISRQSEIIDFGKLL